MDGVADVMADAAQRYREYAASEVARLRAESAAALADGDTGSAGVLMTASDTLEAWFSGSRTDLWGVVEKLTVGTVVQFAKVSNGKVLG